mgnify:CR=1 FL=1
MKYFGGCDVGSTYTKAVIMDENDKILAHTTIKSKINAALSAEAAMSDVVAQVPELKGDVKNLAYLVGTGYGRNKVATADENISEISCHAMGVHITDPNVKAIIDIGGQDIKGIAIDTDGTVKNFAMNDKCAAGTFHAAHAGGIACAQLHQGVGIYRQPVLKCLQHRLCAVALSGGFPCGSLRCPFFNVHFTILFLQSISVCMVSLIPDFFMISQSFSAPDGLIPVSFPLHRF